MLSPELVCKIKYLQIKTKKLLRGKNSGSSMTRRMGTGFEFDQLRDYQVGDNVRSIDWKSSARSNKLIVRSYREDRNRTLILLIDISSSGMFGSGNLLKESVVRDVAVMLSCAAEQMRDNVGAIFFHHSVEKVISLGAGKMHTVILAQEIFTATFKKGGTDIAAACAASLQHFGKDSLVLLISDCLSSSYAKLMATVAQRHDLVVLRVCDPIERELPEGLFIACQDQESGVTIDGTNPVQMAALRSFTKKWYADQDLFFKRLGVDCCDLATDTAYDATLMNFFAQRCL